jgi:hypothetical protein
MAPLEDGASCGSRYAASWVTEWRQSGVDSGNERTDRYEAVQYSGTRRAHLIALRYGPLTRSLFRPLGGNGEQQVHGGRLHGFVRSR